jgi:hypothetical protein
MLGGGEAAMTKSLEQRVVAALTAEPAPSPAELLTLIAALETGIAEANTAAETADKKFLDPVESPDVNKARALMESTQFVAGRLRALLPRLQAKCRATKHEADRQEWEVQFRLLAEERDALAAELCQTYPATVATLVSLFTRIADLDRRLSALHQSRPSGAKGQLLSAELKARELSEFSRDEPSISRELKLPSWTESNKLAWPPPARPVGVVLAEAMSGDADPRYSAHWREALREETDRRIADEQRRIADEAARTAQEKRDYESWLTRLR